MNCIIQNKFKDDKDKMAITNTARTATVKFLFNHIIRTGT